ncbi:MAG: VRR-NUC domain-containing protein [Flexilinea sp.]|nr:VRR-NUC domain-containing protein [Flexilinea sp.]
MKRKIWSESLEQQAVVTYCAFQSWRLPHSDRIFHIGNGGRRTITEAKRFKAEGVKAGVSDLCLPVPMNGYHGMYIEMKRPDHKNKPTAEQKDWLDYFNSVGYKAVVCYGYEEAVTEIQRYYGVPEGEMII